MIEPTSRENKPEILQIPYTLEEVMASGLDVLQGVFSAMDRKQDEVRGLDTAASSTRELHGVCSSMRNNANAGETAVKTRRCGRYSGLDERYI